MGTLLYFSETTLLWIVSGFFILGISWRICFFIVSVFRRRMFSRYGVWHRLATLAGILVPFHRVVFKKPLYVAVRYTFHACLFIVPVWFSGHVYLWEESRLAWYWVPLPDAWADGMTLAVLGACVFFMIRRLVLVRLLETGVSDVVLILIVAMPFLTGYLVAHGTLEGIDFFDSYLWYLHVISAELMLVMIVFLFCRIRLNKKACVGCAACVENCPTETLAYDDHGLFRHFNYSHYQCICCGLCVNVCPQEAAGLGHELDPVRLMQIAAKYEIQKIELKACERCGVPFGPITQLGKLNRSIHRDELEIVTLDLCPRCKKLGSRSGDLTHDHVGFYRYLSGNRSQPSE